MSFTPPQRCNWMMEIKQGHPIGQIVWPGTHNSATNKIGTKFLTRPFGQHQTLPIYDQLRNGVRALDIRVQQDRLVCNGSLLSYNINLVITEIKKFFAKAGSEIIILEIRTERGYTDPPDFEKYLVDELGDLLIHQDDHVFMKTISEVLPRRIICIWKLNNSPRPKAGGPIWSASYLRDNIFETELPLTKFQGNLNNLSEQSPASERNYFYKVENTLTPQTSSALELLLLWPRHAEVVTQRINGFARFFLAECTTKDVLDRLQIVSVDFVDDDFIIACISLNHARGIQPSRVTEMTNNKSDTDHNNKSNSSNNRSKPMSIATDLSISSDVFKAAESLEDCWLSVGGKIKTDMLQPGFKYEVVIVMMLKEDPATDNDNRWNIPVTIKLTRPDGSKQDYEVNLMEKPRGQWIEVLAGDFIKEEGQLGYVKFSLLERGVQTKRMICIKGVSIQQKDKAEIKPPSDCVTEEFRMIDMFADSW